MAVTFFMRPAPVFCAAAGTAAGFYFLPLLADGYPSCLSLIALFIFSITIAALVFSFTVFFRYAAKINNTFELDRKIRLLSVCAIVFITGLVTGFAFSASGKQRQSFGIPHENVSAIEGSLTEDPRIISGGNAMAAVSLKRCASMTPNGFMYATALGDITVFFPESSAVKLRGFGRGASVFLEGALRSNDINNITFSASSVNIIKPASRIEIMRTGVRLKLIERAAGKEWGGLSIALLLGIRDNLDSDLAAMYRKAGSSYILALSGMHLAVLAAIISFLLKKPLGLKPAAAAGAVIICIYCFFVGPLPSLYRAALMYILGAAAVIGFLPRRPLAILSLSFLIQIILTPAAGHSISFILSYLALFGILVIGKPLYEIFAGKAPDLIMQPLSASLGAFIATMGISSSVFGYVAPIGIAAGLILIPLTTLYMILSIIWLVSDFGWPLSMLYRLMEFLVGLAAKVPAIMTSRPVVLIILSVILTIIIILLEYKQRKIRLKLDAFK